MRLISVSSAVVHPEPNVTAEVPVAENDHGSSGAKTNKSSALADFLRNVKNKVVDMACNISSLLQEHFANSSGTSSPKTPDGPFAQFPMRASLMTLAITVIMVVLFKRV